MSEITFWEAMKQRLAHGKMVQFYGDVTNQWIDIDLNKEYNLAYCGTYKWRIKPEPVKYSVDVWLDRVPEKNTSSLFKELIIGEKSFWAFNKTNMCNKHYIITVEECM